MKYPIKNLVLFFCLYTTINIYVNAQQVVHLDSGDGLLNGTINAFEKDSLGYMWIATDQGLNRYSGIEFKNYILKNSDNISNRVVMDMINLQGDLYTITNSGSLYKYQYEKDEFEELYTKNNERFLSITHLEDSKLIIGLSKGFLIYDVKNSNTKNVQHSDLGLNRVVKSYKSNLYSATPRGLYRLEYDATKNSLIKKDRFLEDEDIIDFDIDHLGRIWVGTEVDGLFVISGNEITNVPIGQDQEKTYAIRKINFDTNKNALIAVDRLGLFVLDDTFNTVKQYSHNADNKNSISQNSIYATYVDDSNTYWLGVREGGINIVYQEDNIFNNISHILNEPNSINNNNIRSIFEDAEGTLWFGTENGISKLKDGEWENYSKNLKLKATFAADTPNFPTTPST